MAYTKQGFYSGDKLRASQLDAMEDGIINAETFASQALANTTVMEKGIGNISVQQPHRPDKVTQAEGETAPHFSFTGHQEAGMQGRVQYGAVGNYSASMNGRSAALNKHAFAINNSTIAKGEESFAQGYETIAEGNSSFAGGSGTYAKGKASVALGISTKASGDYSFATGVHSSATNEASFAEGHRTESLGIASHAEGSETEAKGTCSHAQNANTHAIADYSTATGIDTVAEGIASFTAGRGTKATVDSQMVVGRYNAESEDLFVVGTGADKDNPYTAFSVGANGNVKVTKSPEADDEVVRLGDINIRKGPLSSVQQKGATVTKNIDSAAAFNQGKAKSSGAFATGDSTASGWLSTATGYGTEAGSSASFTAGQGTKTTIDCQVAIGVYNIGTKAIFEIGNGSATKRSNAFEVYSNGDIGIYKDGKIYSLQKMLAAYFTDANLK